MILDISTEFPPDIRVEKEIRVLVRAGHEVFLLSPKYRASSAASEYVASLGATVERVPLVSAHRRYARNAVKALTMYDRRWVQPIRAFVRRHGISVLHVHDLFAVPVSLSVANELGIPVIADLHENMPAAMRAARSAYPLWKRCASGVFYNYHLMRWHEARALRRCYAVIVVVPEAAERMSRYGITPSKVRVVSNTEDETTFRFHPLDADPRVAEGFGGSFVLSYVGGMGAHRGLDTTLRALPIILKNLPEVRLLIVGADERTKREIAEAADRHHVARAVDVLPWQPFDKVNSYIMASDICLVPHNDCEHTQTTIPHKLFQYMICGKPVLVSDCRPLKRVVEAAGGGRVFRANDAQSLADEVLLMAADKMLLREMGASGRRAALGDMSWTHDARVLVELYDELGATLELR